jgi:rhamnosyltransferase
MPDSAAADATTHVEGRTIAVMTAFRPDRHAAANAHAILNQVDELVVVDDGSGPVADDVLAAIGAEGCRVIRLLANSGIAAATNTGIAAAAPKDGDVVVFFDQDSEVPPQFVAQLKAALSRARRSDVAVAGVAPEFFADVRQGAVDRHGVLRVDMPIQSGLMITAETLAVVGGMREDLFIDLVDDEFALRVADSGRVFVGAPGTRLPHRLGLRVGLTIFGRPLRVGGRTLPFTVSAPFRYYYRARNRILVNRVHGKRHRVRLILDHLLEVRHYAIVFAAVEQRAAFRAILRAGRRDGRKGIGGRIPSEVLAVADHITWRLPL